MRRVKISRMSGGRLEYSSKSLAAHNGGGPDHRPHDGANEPLLLEARVVSPGDRKVVSLSWTREVRQGPQAPEKPTRGRDKSSQS